MAGSWMVNAASGLAATIAGMVGTFVAATVIIVFMVLLVLSESSLWTQKLGAIWPGRGQDEWRATFDALSRKLRGFLLMRAAMGALSAMLYAGWLMLFGVDLLVVWAMLTFLLSFIPNLGSVISGVLPALYILATGDLGTALLVGTGLFVIEQVIGNFVDPRLQGRQIAISPLVVLVAILVWGWIWGIAGALLAVPMTTALMVGFAHVPALRPIALLLSDQPDEDRLMEAMAR
jgi:AI-2 transport protein TqsA